ncbi:hypothetical protein PS15m_007870 [Mucor circinelloides]
MVPPVHTASHRLYKKRSPLLDVPIFLPTVLIKWSGGCESIRSYYNKNWRKIWFIAWKTKLSKGTLLSLRAIKKGHKLSARNAKAAVLSGYRTLREPLQSFVVNLTNK